MKQSSSITWESLPPLPPSPTWWASFQQKIREAARGGSTRAFVLRGCVSVAGSGEYSGPMNNLGHQHLQRLTRGLKICRVDDTCSLLATQWPS